MGDAGGGATGGAADGRTEGVSGAAGGGVGVEVEEGVPTAAESESSAPDAVETAGVEVVPVSPSSAPRRCTSCNSGPGTVDAVGAGAAGAAGVGAAGGGVVGAAGAGRLTAGADLDEAGTNGRRSTTQPQ